MRCRLTKRSLEGEVSEVRRTIFLWHSYYFQCYHEYQAPLGKGENKHGSGQRAPYWDTGAARVVDDYDAICWVLQLCTEGEAKGEVSKLQEAFRAAEVRELKEPES